MKRKQGNFRAELAIEKGSMVMDQKHAGFTLAELLIVVAIIGVLVAIGIPIFSSQLEKSREATDLANVRSKYAELMAEANTQTMSERIDATVSLKQKREDWQGSDPVTIAGITHYKSEGDTNQWKGVPGPGGSCTIIYDPFMYGVIFEWSGGTGTTVSKDRLEAAGKDISAIHKAAADWVSSWAVSGVRQLEIDSKCKNSKMVPSLLNAISKDGLLKNGTWAYLGDPKHTASQPASEPKSEYFFWTSVDTEKEGAGKEIPVIVCQKDGSFYVSKSTTSKRDEGHIAIAGHQGNYKGFEKFTNGTKYDSFEEAYAAYEKAVNESYPAYKDTLPK